MTGVQTCALPILSGIGFIYDAAGSYTPAFLIGGACIAVCLVLTFVAFAAKKSLKWQE